VRFYAAMFNTTPEAVCLAFPAEGVNSSKPNDSLTPDEIRSQLQRILTSADFVASERNRRFLQHIVECTMRGQTVRGYEIGTLVFGRPKTFNATTDPIVRIEAGKLRRDLETYYLKSGKDDPIRITVPRGAYRTVFARQEARAAGANPTHNSLLLLRTALLGLAGEQGEAMTAWRAVETEYPDFALNVRAHKALEALHAQDDRVRELLLDGLQRAARSNGFSESTRGVAVEQFA
jgi:hypothetical protein